MGGFFLFCFVFVVKCSLKIIFFGMQKGLSFLHNDCKLKHNNVNMSCVFVNPAGEWKLGGVDYITPSEGEGSSIPDKGLKSLEKYNPPEMTDMRARKKICAWYVCYKIST